LVSSGHSVNNVSGSVMHMRGGGLKVRVVSYTINLFICPSPFKGYYIREPLRRLKAPGYTTFAPWRWYARSSFH
jgi:hypothetical protein